MNNLKSALRRIDRKVRPHEVREQTVVFVGLAPLGVPELDLEPYGPPVVSLARRPGLAEFLLVRLDVRDWLHERYTPEQAAAIARAPSFRMPPEEIPHTTYGLLPECPFSGGFGWYLHHFVQWVKQARDGSAPLTVHCRMPDGKLGYRCGSTTHPFDGDPGPEQVCDGFGRNQKTESLREDLASLLHLLWLGSKHVRPSPYAGAPAEWHGPRPANIHNQSALWSVTDRLARGEDGWSPWSWEAMEELSALEEPPIWDGEPADADDDADEEEETP